ncbi:hypothetical protein ACNQ2K_02050 [Mycoplasma sp. VS292A]
MKRKLKILESFAGIGSQYKALKNIYSNNIKERERERDELQIVPLGTS